VKADRRIECRPENIVTHGVSTFPEDSGVKRETDSWTRGFLRSVILRRAKAWTVKGGHIARANFSHSVQSKPRPRRGQQIGRDL